MLICQYLASYAPIVPNLKALAFLLLSLTGKVTLVFKAITLFHSLFMYLVLAGFISASIYFFSTHYFVLWRCDSILHSFFRINQYLDNWFKHFAPPTLNCGITMNHLVCLNTFNRACLWQFKFSFFNLFFSYIFSRRIRNWLSNYAASALANSNAEFKLRWQWVLSICANHTEPSVR